MRVRVWILEGLFRQPGVIGFAQFRWETVRVKLGKLVVPGRARIDELGEHFRLDADHLVSLQMQQRGFLIKPARLGSEAAALPVPLRGLIRTPSGAERGQGHENRRRRLKPAPLGFARVRISHLKESFENVGAAI